MLKTLKMRDSLLYVYAFALIINIDLCHSSRILAIFPFGSKSHFSVDNAVISSLSNAGHEVTVITPFPEIAASANYSRIIDLPEFKFLHANNMRYNENRHTSPKEMLIGSAIYETQYCYSVFNLKDYQDFLQSDEKFDVVFIEHWYLYQCYLPIAEKLKVPVISVVTYKSWFLADRAIGNIYHPADVPFDYCIAWRFNSIYQRFINAWNRIVGEYVNYFYIDPILTRFYKDNEQQLKPYAGFLNIKPELIFYNGHHAVLPRPESPNVIEIGGIHLPSAKKLPEVRVLLWKTEGPKNLQKFIDEAENGVIMFSFGSVVNTSTIPPSIKKLFIDVFASIPQRVVWKIEEDMENAPNNVMFMRWLPQLDILGHRNVKAFISHCGQGSIYEAIHTVTPIIAVPLMFDQPANAAILEHLGVAVTLNIDSLSKDGILRALNSIINDTKYYDNMQKLSKIFKDRPMTPQQSVVYWTEHVLRHKGASHLKSASSQLNWFQYFLLDILSIILITFAFILYTLNWCMKTAMKLYKTKVMLYIRVSYKNKSD